MQKDLEKTPTSALKEEANLVFWPKGNCLSSVTTLLKVSPSQECQSFLSSVFQFTWKQQFLLWPSQMLHQYLISSHVPCLSSSQSHAAHPSSLAFGLSCQWQGSVSTSPTVSWAVKMLAISSGYHELGHTQQQLPHSPYPKT